MSVYYRRLNLLILAAAALLALLADTGLQASLVAPDLSPIDDVSIGRSDPVGSRGDPSPTPWIFGEDAVLVVRSGLLESPSPTPAPSVTPEPTPTPTQPAREYLGDFLVTGYSDSPRNGTDGRGITRSGTKTRWGVVAVDPAVVPLDSRLRVEGMGETIFVALDTGGMVVGRHLDIWFPTDWEALQHGVQERGVYLVPE